MPFIEAPCCFQKRSPPKDPPGKKIIFFRECKANHPGEYFIHGNITNPTIFKFFLLNLRFSPCCSGRFRICLDFVGGWVFFLRFGFFLHFPSSPAPVHASTGHHDHSWNTWRATGPWAQHWHCLAWGWLWAPHLASPPVPWNASEPHSSTQGRNHRGVTQASRAPRATRRALPSPEQGGC